MLKIKILAALCALLPTLAFADGVVYSSIPDLNVSPITQTYNAWCSSCSGSWEPLDHFVLTGAENISGFELAVQTLDSDQNPYGNYANLTVDIFNSDHTSRLFTENVNTTTVLTTNYNTTLITGALSDLPLTAGSYWIGFQSDTMGLPGYSDGNGSLIYTTTHTGQEQYVLGGNIGYQLVGAAPTIPVPESNTYALMALGMGLIGLLARKRPA